jgi:hypothetical protein
MQCQRMLIKCLMLIQTTENMVSSFEQQLERKCLEQEKHFTDMTSHIPDDNKPPLISQTSTIQHTAGPTFLMFSKSL